MNHGALAVAARHHFVEQLGGAIEAPGILQLRQFEYQFRPLALRRQVVSGKRIYMRSVGHVSGWNLTAKRANAAERKHQLVASVRGASKMRFSEYALSLIGKNNNG
jgi:hypothetical protein